MIKYYCIVFFLFFFAGSDQVPRVKVSERYNGNIGTCHQFICRFDKNGTSCHLSVWIQHRQVRLVQNPRFSHQNQAFILFNSG